MIAHTLYLISGPIRFAASEDDAKRLAQELQSHNDELVRCRAEVESLTQQLKVSESFHAVAVQQRDAAWREVERLRTTIEHVAAIAHCGGWVGLNEDQTLVYVRALTMGSMPRGSLNAATAIVNAAITAARAAQEGKT